MNITMAFHPAIPFRSVNTFLSPTPLLLIPSRTTLSPNHSPPLLPRFTMSSIRPILPKKSTSDSHIANSRAVTPMRRPSQPSTYTEQPLPSQRRSDNMAPAKAGPWVILPYLAVSAVAAALLWLARKRLLARQKSLVDEFGQTLVLYGTSPDTQREIVSEYKRKLGPGILRGAMYRSFLAALVSEKPASPAAIKDASVVKALLRLGDSRVVDAFNTLAKDMADAPSLLGKLLFVADRVVAPGEPSLQLMGLFPYGEATVRDLQRNMLERVYREHVAALLDAGVDEPDLTAAALLRLDLAEARSLFNGVVVGRIAKREREAAELAAAEAEESSKPNVSELDYPARSGQPAKAAVHAYQCGDCGYTLFPAAGREFKFYGDDFVCPACGAPKGKFDDLNSEE